MARAISTRLKNRFGKRFLLVFLRWQRYRILEMAFVRTTALEFLRRAYEQNRLAHAYLITGVPGSGKEVLAAELTSLVNGTPTKDVFSAKAREVFIARPESKSRRIVIEQIRDLEHDVATAYGRFIFTQVPGKRRTVPWLKDRLRA